MNQKENSLHEELLCCIWLQLVLGVGNRRVAPLLNCFGNAVDIFKLGFNGCKDSGFFSEKELGRIKKFGIKDAEKIFELCEKNKIKCVCITQPQYPNKLKNIPYAPLVLYYQGVLPDVDELPSVCIVGPRKVSDFGEKSAYSLGYRLALGGMVIVSGIALGSDSAALLGALKANGKVISVLPCGLMHDYLAVNRPLKNKILRQDGCLLSEFPPEMGVGKYSFHIRNRILSGLSLGTVVVEAGERSGALITANHANEQGRDVFVIPGNPTLPQYKGSNKLLCDGAKPILDAKSIFNEYLYTYSDKIDIEKAYNDVKLSIENKTIQKKSSEGLSKFAKIVYNNLDKPKFTADDLLDLKIDDGELLSVLTELEICGYIEAVPGGFYTLL